VSSADFHFVFADFHAEREVRWFFLGFTLIVLLVWQVFSPFFSG
jgi:hypothetical protein